MKKVLITGGAGYIGSKLTTTLLNNNFKVSPPFSAANLGLKNLSYRPDSVT